MQLPFWPGKSRLLMWERRTRFYESSVCEFICFGFFSITFPKRTNVGQVYLVVWIEKDEWVTQWVKLFLKREVKKMSFASVRLSNVQEQFSHICRRDSSQESHELLVFWSIFIAKHGGIYLSSQLSRSWGRRMASWVPAWTYSETLFLKTKG